MILLTFLFQNQDLSVKHPQIALHLIGKSGNKSFLDDTCNRMLTLFLLQLEVA